MTSFAPSFFSCGSSSRENFFKLMAEKISTMAASNTQAGGVERNNSISVQTTESDGVDVTFDDDNDLEVGDPGSNNPTTGVPGGPSPVPASTNQHQIVKIEHYVLGETLGVGTFGKVKSELKETMNIGLECLDYDITIHNYRKMR